MSEVCRFCKQVAFCLLQSARDQCVYICMYCGGAFLSVPLPNKAAFYTPVSSACPLAARARNRLTMTPYVCQEPACQKKIAEFFRNKGIEP